MPNQPGESALSFMGFVLSLASTAAIHFGDMPDPITGRRSEVNLDGAAQMIEILALLDQKTRGNLTAEEPDPRASALRASPALRRSLGRPRRPEADY